MRGVICHQGPYDIMNILLSELQSPGLEPSPGAPAPTSDGQEFAQMLQQNIQSNSGHNGHIVEFKGFLGQFEALDESAELAMDRPGKDWSAYALRIEDSPGDVDEGLVMLRQSLLPADNTDSSETLLPAIHIQLRGENLPVSGNSLPLSIPLQMPPAGSQIEASDGVARSPAPIATPLPLDPGQGLPDPVALPEAIASTTATPMPSLQNPTAATGQREQAVILAPGSSLESGKSIPAGLLPGEMKLQGDSRIAQAGMAPLTQAVSSELAQQARTAQQPVVEPLPGKASQLAEPLAQSDSLLQNAVKTSQSSLTAQDGEPLPLNNSSSAQPPVNIASHAAAAHTVAASPNQASLTSAVIPMPTQLQSMALASPADSIDWSNGLGERVSWMIDQKQNVANIRLDPPTLGKLEIQIRMGDDSTTVSILTQHAQTRELIDSASLRLRDILQEAGYQNVNVDVSQRQDQQRAATQQAQPEDSDDMGDNAAGSDNTVTPGLEGYSVKGLVDTFA